MTLPWCALSMRHVTCVWSETYCLIRRNNAMYARTVVSVLKPIRWRYGSFVALTHQASSIHSPPLHYFSRWHIVYHIVYDVDLTASYLSLSYLSLALFFIKNVFHILTNFFFFFTNKKSTVSNSVQHSNSRNMPMPFNSPLDFESAPNFRYCMKMSTIFLVQYFTLLSTCSIKRTQNQQDRNMGIK